MPIGSPTEKSITSDPAIRPPGVVKIVRVNVPVPVAIVAVGAEVYCKPVFVIVTPLKAPAVQEYVPAAWIPPTGGALIVRLPATHPVPPAVIVNPLTWPGQSPTL